MGKRTNQRRKDQAQARKLDRKRRRTWLTANVKLSLALVAAVVAVVAGILLADGEENSTSTGTIAEQLVRPDSQKLATASTDDVLVEFLDFECEACGAIYPTVEELRNEYGDRMSFVVRYMPLHTSSVNAAKAAEAAAAQGQFEAMYKKLFEAQAEWGHQQTPAREPFFRYATELGLDMAAFEQAYNDPATEAKIKRDQADGQALGVQGTPTFFLNGEKLNVRNGPALKAEVERALSE